MSSTPRAAGVISTHPPPAAMLAGAQILLQGMGGSGATACLPSCAPPLQVSGPGGQRLPAAVDVQTVLLLGLAEAAAEAELAADILAFNASRWERASSGYASILWSGRT